MTVWSENDYGVVTGEVDLGAVERWMMARAGEPVLVQQWSDQGANLMVELSGAFREAQWSLRDETRPDTSARDILNLYGEDWIVAIDARRTRRVEMGRRFDHVMVTLSDGIEITVVDAEHARRAGMPLAPIGT